MRNVVTLSDIPVDLHEWLKNEAKHQTGLTGKRVGIYKVVLQAIRDYKKKIEGQNVDIPNKPIINSGEIMRKKLQPAEIQRGCVRVPKGKQGLFPGVGQIITIQDAKDGSTYETLVGSQYRLDLKNWYRNHEEVASGDEIIFEGINGVIRVNILRCE